MPMQRADNSFDSNDSKMVRSVEYDNVQDAGKFTKVFESASSRSKKMQKSDVDKKPKPAVYKETAVFNEEEKIIGLDSKNEKLIGLRKINPNNLKVETKKSKNLITESLDNSTNLESINSENNKSEEVVSDNYSEALLINPAAEAETEAETEAVTEAETVIEAEAKDNSNEKLFVPNSISISMESSEAVVPGKLKDSVSLKTVSNEKQKSNDKKNLIKKDSKSSKSKISVFDLRHSEVKTSKAKQAELTAERESQKFFIENSDLPGSEKIEESKPIVIELTHVKDNFSSESKTLTTASSSALMKQLEENINGKIVKQSSIILKDGGSGEIKLILKPDKLGSVRIRLSLTDKNISGQIIVDSSAVKEIFEQNLQNLIRAFKENGFDTAALNVSVGGDHSGSENHEQGRNFSKQLELIDEIIPTMISESENLIDLVV